MWIAPVARGVALGLLLVSADAWSQGTGGSGPLQFLALDDLHSLLPSSTHLMVHPASVEQFLIELDVSPPDWAMVYGHGHHDPGHDDRLFELNRERDAKRAGRPALSKRLAFCWTGELSQFNPQIEGFPVALGPKFMKTSWGMVRFKPEEAPGNLSVTTDLAHRQQFQRQLDQGQTVEIEVVMTGVLIPDESIVYDFSHDEEGLGLIMPFVRVERVDFVMKP
ncbi:MAG TPA: hypothetical protein VKB81_01370 [Nitrospira sp.]|nr:hypothetical protein [Nitrospira sp.]